MRKPIIPLRDFEGEFKPEECLPCALAYRCSDAVAVLIETDHPDYAEGIRVVGLCGSHAELADLEGIGFIHS